MKIYSKLAGLGGGIGAGALMIAKCFATPTYVMDSALQTGVTTLFTDFVSGAFTIIVAALGVIGTYYVSIRLIHVFMRWINKFSHH